MSTPALVSQETITVKLAACGIRAGIVLVILVILLVILVMFFCHRGHPFVILVLFFAILVILANLNCHPGHFLYLREAFHFFYLDQVTFFLYVHPLAPSSGSGTLLWSLQERWRELKVKENILGCAYLAQKWLENLIFGSFWHLFAIKGRDTPKAEKFSHWSLVSLSQTFFK